LGEFNDLRDTLGTLRINALSTPGIAKVSPIMSELEWQNSQGFAMSGVITRFAGNKVRLFTVKFKLTAAQRTVWNKSFAAPLAQPAPGVRVPSSIDIAHPYFAECKIRRVCTVSISHPYWDTEQEKGMYIVDWNGQEYGPGKPLNPRVIDPLRSPESTTRAKTSGEVALERMQASNDAKQAEYARLTALAAQ
jgi:hypothetical protein